VLVLIVPIGLLVGWKIHELTSWNPPPPPPRPRYLSASPLPSETSTVVPATKSTKRAASVYYSEWTSYEAAMAESKRTGKPLMIDFSADWCGPCQRLRSDVFDEHALAQEIQNVVIPVSIVDRVRERGFNSEGTESLQQQYNANAFPTLVVVSARTGLMMRTQGYAGPRATVAWIRESARLVR
jgi:thiol-disulfide isomerase/thioredoxin